MISHPDEPSQSEAEERQPSKDLPASDENPSQSIEEISPDSHEDIYRVTHPEHGRKVVKIPKHLFPDKPGNSSPELVQKYIDINEAIRELIDDEDIVNPELAERIHIADMQKVSFHQERGYLEDEGATASIDKYGVWNQAVLMEDLDTEDQDIFDFEETEADTEDEIRAKRREFLKTKLDEIKTAKSQARQILMANNIQSSRLEPMFHILITGSSEEDFDWKLVPLDYTNAFLLDETSETQPTQDMPRPKQRRAAGPRTRRPSNSSLFEPE